MIIRVEGLDRRPTYQYPLQHICGLDYRSACPDTVLYLHRKASRTGMPLGGLFLMFLFLFLVDCVNTSSVPMARTFGWSDREGRRYTLVLG